MNKLTKTISFILKKEYYFLTGFFVLLALLIVWFSCRCWYIWVIVLAILVWLGLLGILKSVFEKR